MPESIPQKAKEQSMSEIIRKDPSNVAIWLRVARRSAIGLALIIALPFLISLFRYGSIAGLNLAITPGLYVLAYVIAMPLSFIKRINWGDALIFDEKLTVLRGDKPQMVVARQDVLHTTVRPGNVFLAIYMENGVKRRIAIGSEGFTPGDWIKVEAAASEWVAR